MDTKVVMLARIGSTDQQIVYGKAKDLLSIDLGDPLHSIILPGDLHQNEAEFLRLFAIAADTQ